MFADHFVVSLIADHLDNTTSRALLCVCKAATTIKEQSPMIYNKLRTQKAAWRLLCSPRRELWVDFDDDDDKSDVFFLGGTLSRASKRRMWPTPVDIKVRVSLGTPLFCGAFPFLFPEEEIPKWSLVDLKRIYWEKPTCKVSWYLDFETTGATEACQQCAAFRSALLGLEPETCHVAKKMKTE